MSTPNTPKDQMKERILAKVQSGEVRMKPRSYFATQIFLSVVLSIIVFVLTVFIASFILFSTYEGGDAYLLGFGVYGILSFLELFPWTLIVLNIGLIIALEALLRRFPFVYRISLLRIFGVIVVASVVIGWAITHTPLHDAILERSDRAGVPVLGRIYESIRGSRAHYGIFRGIVVSTGDAFFIMAHDDFDHDADDGVRVVHITPDTVAPAVIHVGDKVYVAGSEKDNEVQAYGVQVFSF